MDFNVAFDRLIGHEGKLSLNPKDRGNWTSGIIGVGELKGTKYGVSAMSYPNVDIRNLTLEQAKKIYFDDFWSEVDGENLYDGVAWQSFDFCVNSGAGNAIRALQRALRVVPDGRFGEVSRAAAKAMSETDQIMLLMAERIEFVSSTRAFRDGGMAEGLMRRMAQNLRYGAVDS